MSNTNLIPSTVNPDLQKERNAASFNVEEFATWFHGGAKKLKFKRFLEKTFYEDTEKNVDDAWIYQTHEEVYENSVEQSINLSKKLRKLQEEINPGGNDIFPAMMGNPVLWGVVPAGNPFGVHYLMMVKTIKGHGTDEQYEKFGKPSENFSICGTYAQTELGHGTFLRGLETRADYDKKTQEFVLNTPRLSSYKWWPGGLGHSSNHCVLVAQLFIDNKPKGIQFFFVPLRDQETHMPLPGVDIGDIGKKMGFFAADNGFLGLKNVRIPRTNMLMRNAQVLPDGTFKKSPVSVLTYFTMVYVRCVIAKQNTVLLSICSTIATRYSAVRHQSPINENEPEPQIIDHVTQQLKVFPEIAYSIAHQVASNSLWKLYVQTSAEIERGEYMRLPEMHALSCVLKVLCSADSAAGADRLRMACGGHGYLSSSNFDRLFASATAACTYEGENTVLLLQVGRFLIKTWRAVVAGQQLPPTTAYIKEAAALKQFPKWTGSWACLVKAVQYAAANKTRLAYENLSQRLAEGQTEAEAANNTGIELTQAAELHGRAFLCSTILEEVAGASSHQRSSSLNNVLRNLMELFLVQTVLRYMSDILRFIPLTDADLRALQKRLEQVLKQLRPDAVAICDGFDYTDNSLRSTLGAYDGNVYERLFDAAKKSPMNQKPVPDAFEKHLKPFLKSNM